MKALHTMRFVTEATVTLAKYEQGIKNAETYENAKGTARQMMGYIDCLVSFSNTMICMENNEFTGEFCEVLDDWMDKMYQALAEKARETKQEDDVVWKLLVKRDDYACR